MKIDNNPDESSNEDGSDMELEPLEDYNSDELIQNKHRNLNLTKIITGSKQKYAAYSTTMWKINLNIVLSAS